MYSLRPPTRFPRKLWPPHIDSKNTLEIYPKHTIITELKEVAAADKSDQTVKELILRLFGACTKPATVYHRMSLGSVADLQLPRYYDMLSEVFLLDEVQAEFKQLPKLKNKRRANGKGKF